jgi:hypothetical protein
METEAEAFWESPTSSATGAGAGPTNTRRTPGLRLLTLLAEGVTLRP